MRRSNSRQAPVAREGIYELYWIFAARRQEAFELRLTGAPGPWTRDPIIQKFKFCNVYRAADRVSQYLIRNVAYRASCDQPQDRIFQIIAFRTFSEPETWECVIRQLGRMPTLDDLSSGEFERALDIAKAERGRLYTGAFILCANKAFGFDEKHRNHVALFKHMFLKHGAAERILSAGSLGEIVSYLGSFPLTGPFMSYQFAIDLNYSPLIAFSENDFTQAGPGALRGIRKAFSDLGAYKPSDIIQMMVERQAEEFKRLDLPFRGLWGRSLHAIDCQGLFCELDKYCREAAPYLPSNRSRIKARFTPSATPIAYFFPPKWGINDLVEQDERLRPIGSALQLPLFGA
jgi:hypothetical protein